MEPIEAPQSQIQTNYAGFWLRLAAYIIDYFIVGFVIGTIVAFVMLAMGLSFAIFQDIDNPANQLMVVTLSIILGVVALTASWMYYALLESSSHQGTLGKIALNLKVTDLQGQPISFLRATGRFFGKFLSSATIYIGYLMIGFTEKQQGLHDILASCLVLRK